jgi:chromosome segregation ATPase
VCRLNDELQRKVDELTDSYEASCRALDILTLDKSNLETQLEAEHALVVQFQYDNERIKAERDNLAADLLTCNREREQLRKHLGIALDHAHDICSLVDIDGNVLDVGD